MVITLTADLDSKKAEAGSETFVTPTAYHFGVVFFMSATAVMPSSNERSANQIAAKPSTAGRLSAAPASVAAVTTRFCT